MKDISEMFDPRWGVFGMSDEDLAALDEVLDSGCPFVCEICPSKTEHSIRIRRDRENGTISCSVYSEMDGFEDGAIISDAASAIGREDELDKWYEKNVVYTDESSWTETDVYRKWKRDLEEECRFFGATTEATVSRILRPDMNAKDLVSAIEHAVEEVDSELEFNYGTIQSVVGECLDMIKNK